MNFIPHFSLNRYIITITLSTTCLLLCTQQLNAHAGLGLKKKSSSISAPINHAILHGHDKNIRVLLEEHDAGQTLSFVIKTPHHKEGIDLESPLGSDIRGHLDKQTTTVICKNGELYLQHKDFTCRRIKYHDIVLRSSDNIIMLNGKSYNGEMRLVIDKPTNKLMVVNTLCLDDYIYAVLLHESVPYWPEEFQKIQAITSRTYAVFLMQYGHGKNLFRHYYDIKNTIVHQQYKGLHGLTALRKAVDQTHDIVLAYNNTIALTMFDSCCGGIIPAHVRHRDTTKPYLCRSHQCLYCKGSKLFSWKKNFDSTTFLEGLRLNDRIKDKIPSLGKKIVDIQVTDKDKAGIVHKIKIAGSNKPIVLTGNQLRSSFFNHIKSYSLSVKKEKDTISISGKGFGHQLGLCQCGANELVKKGWDHRKVLDFYFPGTRLCKLA